MKIPKPKNLSKVRIVSNGSGRFALFGIWLVPVSLLGLGSGEDAWMRDVELPCLVCGLKFKAGEMENEFCPACFNRACEENEALDHPQPTKEPHES